MTFEEIGTLSLPEVRLAILLGIKAIRRAEAAGWLERYEMDRLAALRRREDELSQVEAGRSPRRGVDRHTIDVIGG
jgi:hypothetical protein